jgi:hypothetical protein
MPRIALTAVIFAIALAGCGSETKRVEKAAAPARPRAPKPVDESRRFPPANLKSAIVVEDRMLGHDFLPGGNLATYLRGGKQHQLFLIKLHDAAQSGAVLFDYKQNLKDAKFISSFGGYFGDDNGTPVFVFTKEAWLLGVVGLDQAGADAAGREFAGRL